jgi:hypothetical protein
MKKISPFDQLMALRYSGQYAKDYDRYIEEYRNFSQKHPNDVDTIFAIPSLPGSEKNLSESFYREIPIKLSKLTKEFCNKYNLIFPVEPDFDITDQYEMKRQLRKIGSPVTLIFPKVLVAEFQNCDSGNTAINILKALFNERVLLLVDKRYPRDQIRKGFDQFLENETKKSEKRLGESSLDIWKVYRQKKIDRLSFAKIATEHQKGIKDTGFDAREKQVGRAYKQACAIIEFIEKTAQSRTK